MGDYRFDRCLAVSTAFYSSIIDISLTVPSWAVTVVMHCLLPIVLNPSLTVFNY